MNNAPLFNFNASSNNSSLGQTPLFNFNAQTAPPQQPFFNFNGNVQQSQSPPLFNFNTSAQQNKTPLFNFNGNGQQAYQNTSQPFFNFNAQTTPAFNFSNDKSNDTHDIQTNYKTIAQKFVEHYYTTYDTNLVKYPNLFTQDCCVTYINIDMKGQMKLTEHMASLNSSFKHENLTWLAQPFKNQRILIVVTGTMHVYSLGIEQSVCNFSESIILAKDTNKMNGQVAFFIENMILKLT